MTPGPDTEVRGFDNLTTLGEDEDEKTARIACRS